MSVDFDNAHPDMDYRMHLESYRLFVHLVKYGAAAAALTLILLAIFLL